MVASSIFCVYLLGMFFTISVVRLSSPAYGKQQKPIRQSLRTRSWFGTHRCTEDTHSVPMQALKLSCL